jgi:hypothetical protein
MVSVIDCSFIFIMLASSEIDDHVMVCMLASSVVDGRVMGSMLASSVVDGVFVLTRRVLEPTIYHTRGRHINHQMIIYHTRG